MAAPGNRLLAGRLLELGIFFGILADFDARAPSPTHINPTFTFTVREMSTKPGHQCYNNTMYVSFF